MGACVMTDRDSLSIWRAMLGEMPDDLIIDYLHSRGYGVTRVWWFRDEDTKRTAKTQQWSVTEPLVGVGRRWPPEGGDD